MNDEAAPLQRRCDIKKRRACILKDDFFNAVQREPDATAFDERNNCRIFSPTVSKCLADGGDCNNGPRED